MTSSSSSCCQITFGIMVLTIAVMTGIVFHLSAIPSDIHIHLDPTIKIDQSDLLLGKTTTTLTSEQIDEYYKDGVIFVKNLISQEEALQLKNAANIASSRLFNIFGLFAKSRYKTIMFDLWRTSADIATFSLQSLPHVAAQLMTTTTTTTKNTDSIRLLRDAFFEYQPPGEGCGWHVDDAGFWPAKEDTTGPTFWIALDPLTVKEGGGLAVLNRTLFKETEPLDITEEFCRKAITGATCDMPEKSPECHAKMEATKIQLDMQPGDAIVWDRFTFHRGVAGTDLLPEDSIKQRYSVRYMPKGSKAFGAVHSSVQQHSEFDSPYYPQVWPTLIESEMKALEHGLDSDLTLYSALKFVGKMTIQKLNKTLFPPNEES